MISVASLVAAGVKPTQARLFAEPLKAACALFDIATPARAAAFVGQCMLESENFSDTEEDLFYRTPERVLEVFRGRVTSLGQAAKLAKHPKELANTVYAGVNGNTEPGDGWKFRGRGLIQLTGRANYRDAEIGLARPYIDQPDLVAEPSDACLTAAWYWHSRKLNILADSWQIDAITKAVNGRRMLHADLRRQYSEQALQAMA
jgi:putative chitinase